jgi:hypothetical protein
MMNTRLNLCAALPNLVLAFSLMLTGCSNTDRNGHDDGETSGTLAKGGGREGVRLMGASLEVTDLNGFPIAGATIMIGTAQNTPFTGNILTTDSNGEVAIPAAWNDAEPVTIDATGYVRATYFAQTPQPMSYTLRATPADLEQELKGNTTGFGQLLDDGNADVGVVFPAIPRSQASLGQVTSLISPQADTISAYGETIQIPSNITFPDQTQTYILPIEINKPAYRVYLPQNGNYQMVAVHARFPFGSSIDAIRSGKNFLDLINTLDFKEAAIQNVTVASPLQSTDLSVHSFTFAPSIPFAAPQFASTYTLLAISLPEINGQYYAADVKNVASQKTLNLNGPSTGVGKGLVVAVLRKSSNKATSGAQAEELSSVTMAASVYQSFGFLGLISPPTVTQASITAAATPAAISGVDPVMTYALLSKIEVVPATLHGITLERKIPQWEMFASNWNVQLKIPQWPGWTQPSGGYRWDLTFAGKPQGTPALTLGPSALENVSHVTRNAVEL